TDGAEGRGSIMDAYPSLKRLAKRVSRALSISPSSGPSTRICTFAPSSAASIIRPMMDLPSTSTSPLRTFTLDLKRCVVCTNKAAGRAWRPSLFWMVKSFSVIQSKHSWPVDAEKGHGHRSDAHQIEKNEP